LSRLSELSAFIGFRKEELCGKRVFVLCTEAGFCKISDKTMGRYVPKTYNNRRFLRIILWVVIFLVLAAIVTFLLLFFVLEKYFVDGKLEIPWLVDVITMWN